MSYSRFYFLPLIVAIGFTAQAAWSGNELRNLAPHGTFEEEVGEFYGWIPLGVVAEEQPSRVQIIEGEAHSGNKSLQIVPGPQGLVKGLVYFADYNSGESKRKFSAQGGVRGARTFAMRLEPSMTAMETSVWLKGTTGDTFSFSAVWTTRKDRKNPAVEIRRDVVKKADRVEGDWKRFEIVVERPSKAHQLQLWLETEDDAPLLADDVNLRFTYRPELMLLVDQLGYAPDSISKTAVLQSTLPLSEVSQAQLLDEQTGEIIWQADLVAHGLLSAWDRYHWKVDFSEVKRPGRYRMAIRNGTVTTRSAPFQIAENLLTKETAELAYRFYYYQRCGIEIPGFHAACHLDDATMPDGSHRDLTGGWHDAGDYNKYNGLTPESVYSLAWAYHCKPELYDQWDRDQNGLADILDEAIWGAQFLEKMLNADRLELLNSVSSGYRYWGAPEKETDNLPNTDDERPVRPGSGDSSYCVSGFALLGQALKKSNKHGRGDILIVLSFHSFLLDFSNRL
ncbi:MAG: glycoside hydrolase family 9 protein, partial [Pirellulales bacterium]